MRSKQFCTPHLVTSSKARALEHVPFDEGSIRESWFQDLLYKHPSLIPVDEIEPLFASMVPLMREMQTGAGPVDIVYINEKGFLTLVETKLFRNPEARRTVVAQILDYATAMSQWSYEDLCNAVRKPSPGASETSDPIKPLVCDHLDYDEARFIDAVSHNLARGRFLLLIVGDGIHSGVEHLAETLAKTPHLGFSLAIVELALFKIGDAKDEYFVQPRVMARTKEVTRAVIELRTPLTPSDVKVSLPADSSGEGGEQRRRLTEEIMFESIGAKLGKPVVDQLRSFLSECEKIGIEPETRGTSISLFWYEPNTTRRFSFASLYAEDGAVDLRFVLHNYRKSGLDKDIGMSYVNAISDLVPGSIIKKNVKDGKDWTRIFVGAREITLADLLPKSAQWLDALHKVIAATELAGAAKSGL